MNVNYLRCSNCQKKVSNKTNEKSGLCNNCKLHELIEKYYKNEEFLRTKLKNKEYDTHVRSIIEFINKSSFSNTLKYRVIVDFVKVLNEYERLINISENRLNEIYMRKSAIKSPGILELIKIYLFSINAINFEKNENDFFPVDIRPNSRYSNDILNYFFNDKKCSDCGSEVTKNSKHSFCYSCIEYRSLFIVVSKDFIKEKFKSKVTEDLYLCYIEFLYSLWDSPNVINDILRKSLEYIYFTEKYLPKNFVFINTVKQNKKFRVIQKKEYYNFLLLEDWEELFLEKFSEHERKTYYLKFLEKMRLLNPKNNNKRTEEILKNKIEHLPFHFQKSLMSYLDIMKLEIKNLEKKMASKSKKWITINTKFNEIFSFIRWIDENTEIKNWPEVTDKEANLFLLTLPEKSRAIQKRTLYNFFEYCLKKKWIFNNPIDKFVARDFKITNRALTLKEHAHIYHAITNMSNEYPIESFTSSLIYFHALTPKQVISIQLKDIIPLKKIIIVSGRAPVFLSDKEFSVLKDFLDAREYRIRNKKSNYLYCSNSTPINGKMRTSTITKYVKLITEMCSKDLRRVGIQYCAEHFGVEYLQQCLGLSLTQSNRYGDIEDNYIEEIIEDSLDNITLEKYEKNRNKPN